MPQTMGKWQGIIAWLASAMVVCLVAVLVLSLIIYQSGQGGRSLIEGSREEGALLIYSATDEPEFAHILNAFKALYPGVDVDYRPLGTQEIYDQVRQEKETGASTADLVISSAMDLQIKLVNDGFAQPYATPQRKSLPDWAIWKSEAYAISSEPIVFIYNRDLLDGLDVPRTHFALARELYDDAGPFRERLGVYDPARSPTGYFYYSQDLQIAADNWDLIAAIGRAHPELYLSSRSMIEDVRSGKLLFAYNVIGSYAFEQAANDPTLGVVIPEDYVMVTSRVAFISRRAAHPKSAKLFLDFLLSPHGQQLMAQRHMMPVRPDVEGQIRPAQFTNVREIRVGPALMAPIDQMTRRGFLKRWDDNSLASVPDGSL